MKKYFLTRLALALPVILLVSVFSFALVFLAPGDPAAQYRTLEMTDEEYEQLKTELGYNDRAVWPVAGEGPPRGLRRLHQQPHRRVAPHQGQAPGYRGAHGRLHRLFPAGIYPTGNAGGLL